MGMPATQGATVARRANVQRISQEVGKAGRVQQRDVAPGHSIYWFSFERGSASHNGIGRSRWHVQLTGRPKHLRPSE
jgi:hypothetical protein